MAEELPTEQLGPKRFRAEGEQEHGGDFFPFAAEDLEGTQPGTPNGLAFAAARGSLPLAGQASASGVVDWQAQARAREERMDRKMDQMMRMMEMQCMMVNTLFKSQAPAGVPTGPQPETAAAPSAAATVATQPPGIVAPAPTVLAAKAELPEEVRRHFQEVARDFERRM